MNNPYAPKPAAKKAPVSTREILFAPEVYRDDPAPPKRDLAAETAKNEIARLRAELRGETRALRAAVNRPKKAEENHDMTAELASLRSAVSELVASQGQQKATDLISAQITACGVEGPAASTVARIANAKKNGRGDAVRAALASMIDTTPAPWELAQQGPVLIGLVGPAGVGKTTTAAKLAAQAIMAKKTVALVSCDAFRVGAIDQLGKYADLMDAKFHTALSQDELLDIVNSETADVIIVDTVGRAIDHHVTEALLGANDVRTARGRRTEVLLCVPASIRAGDMTRVACDFGAVQPTGLIITKLDETSMPAGIIHASFTTKLPLAAVCTGQRVPEDIMPANVRVLVDALLPSKTEESK